MKKKYQNKYRIEPNRWQYWDYSAPGSYFITIVTIRRECILGDIANGVMVLSEYGKIVETEFLKINNYHNRAKLDEYIIMPNHVHCIITLMDYNENDKNGDDGDGGGGGDGDGDGDGGNGGGNGGGNVEKIHEFSLLTTDEIKQYRKLRRNMVLIKILGKFQQQTSKQINIIRNTPGNKNWQRDFYDHVIRDNNAYQRIKNYIINNPQKWDDDKFYE